MNKKIAIPLVLLALVGIFAGGYFAGSHRHEQEEKHQWTCGMHPFIIRDAPGLCPICEMELTPLKPGTSGQGGASVQDSSISIDPVTAQNMGVRMAPVIRRDLSRIVRTVGLVTTDESRQTSISTKVEGYLERLYIDQTGQQVEKGSALAEIYSPELVSAQQEYLLALRNREKMSNNAFPAVAESAQRLLEAARTRLKYWDISDAQIAALEQSGAPRKTLTLHSPYRGVVTMKKAVQGMRVMPGEELLQLADLSTIWVNAEIYSADLPWVKVGQNAEVELPAAPGQMLKGKVTFLYPFVTAETRTVKARIELANPGLALKPDMFANVIIRGRDAMQALAVPAEAILDSGTTQTVFVSLGEGKFEPRAVQVGVKDDAGFVQIRSGLQLDEQVVVSAQFMLDSESKLREALRKMTEPQAPVAPAVKKEKLDDLFK